MSKYIVKCIKCGKVTKKVPNNHHCNCGSSSVIFNYGDGFPSGIEHLPLKEHWRLTAKHIKTGEIIIKEGHNLIVSVGKYLVCRMLIDEAGYDTGLTYQAIGTNNTAPALGDTLLTVETARKVITSKTRVLNEITYSTFMTAAESTFNIKEAGIFGHSTASAVVNTGILFSHWLVAFDNSGGLFDLTFDYILQVG